MKIGQDLSFKSCMKNDKLALNRSNSQFNEDSKIYKRFFTHPRYIGNGTFVEMGGSNGVTFSNTLVYEYCLGWNGLLIEANPISFQYLEKQRPCTNNFWAAGNKAWALCLSFGVKNMVY